MTAQSLPPSPSDLSTRAHMFALGLAGHARLPGGEEALAHACAMAAIVKTVDEAQEMQAACYLIHTCDALSKPAEVLTKNFGPGVARLVLASHQLIALQARTQHAIASDTERARMQTENARKMLLAFGQDLRVVLLHLASRLQTLRYCAASRQPPPPSMAQETLDVYAPLANRLGLGGIKWEMEDLSLRFLEPEVYREIATLLAAKRDARHAQMQTLQGEVLRALGAHGIVATVHARPKHIYSIVKKMRGKNLPFSRVFDLRAMRVLVSSVEQCYAALDFMHSRFQPIMEEFDDYIAHPKPNGYQSLHTVVRDHTDGEPIEIQIRTHEMHAKAELGVAAHWAYKEAGTRGYGGVVAAGDYEQKIALLRSLLAWEREVASGAQAHEAKPGLSTDVLQDRIYVLTPEAQIVDLPAGATPVDFAYALHTRLGERCRGAVVDGQLVPLNTALHSGQTVSITAAKEGGPSRDWLNPELKFLVTARARTKVRAWFKAQAHAQTVARGREMVEKLLQREGKTAIKLEELAAQLQFDAAEDLFDAVGKDEFSLKSIEHLWRNAQTPLPEDAHLLSKLEGRQRHSGRGHSANGVLVAGVDSLMTQLAKCCRPAPPDPIGGFITKGKGVSIHRTSCTNFMQMRHQALDRVIEVSWGAATDGVYPVDICVQASDRAGLLRDITEVLARERLHIVGVQSQTVREGLTPAARMIFTVEVSEASRLQSTLAAVRAVSGVHSCHRR